MIEITDNYTSVTHKGKGPNTLQNVLEGTNHLPIFARLENPIFGQGVKARYMG